MLWRVSSCSYRRPWPSRAHRNGAESSLGQSFLRRLAPRHEVPVAPLRGGRCGCEHTLVARSDQRGTQWHASRTDDHDRDGDLIPCSPRRCVLLDQEVKF